MLIIDAFLSPVHLVLVWWSDPVLSKIWLDPILKLFAKNIYLVKITSSELIISELVFFTT